VVFLQAISIGISIYNRFPEPFALTPPPTAPVPAAILPLLAFPPKNRPTPPPTLPTTTLANHGVAQTLSRILAGKNTFVIAYAVATSTKILLDDGLTCHLFPSSLTVTSTSSLLFSAIGLEGGAVSSLRENPNHPFLAKYRPNFSVPSVMYCASVQYYSHFSSTSMTHQIPPSSLPVHFHRFLQGKEERKSDEHTVGNQSV
jgi:hypothetical protein